MDNGQHLTGLAIDQNGYKWIQSFRNGVIVFDDGGTLANTNDDKVAFLSTNEGSGSLPSNEVRDIKIDKNNVIKEITLNKAQYANIYSLVTKINFNEIENNISIDELAVDRAIKGIFTIDLKEKKYEFEFNHQKLPDTIQNLLNQLEGFLN